MILGYISGLETNPVLCLVADKPSDWSVPVKIDTVEITAASVLLISNEEGATVKKDPSENGIHIEAIRPAHLYLTPNLPERPGFSVAKVKIVTIGDRKYKIHFDRGRGWEPWTPNQKLY